MSPEEIATLNRARSAIVRYLRPTEVPFLEHLQSERVLSDGDVERIRNICEHKTNSDGVRELLHVYVRKAPSLEPLREALRLCCYTGMYNALALPAEADNVVHSPTTEKRLVANLVIRGKVPRNPEVYIERRQLLDTLKRALLEIGNAEDGGWVVIHGMAGIGKSVVAASVLSDPTVTGSTFSAVHWLDIGPQGDDRRLLKILNDLYSAVDTMDRQLKLDSIDHATHKLLEAFMYESSNALIVLDDVWTESVIRTFAAIRCRILVTTRDVTVLDVVNGRKRFVDVPDSGFKLDEASEAFAKWLRKDAHSLPEEAAEIYAQCRGHPFEISLIGALLREYPNRWTFYYKMLRERKLAEIKKRTPYQYENFVAAISVSLDTLPDNFRSLYRSLAVFERGSDLSSRALSELWRMDEIEVEDIMSYFIKRSLIERRVTYPANASGDTYRVHSLIHDTLKILNEPEEIRIANGGPHEKKVRGVIESTV